MMIKRIASILLSIAIAVFSCFSVFAASAVDISKPCSLTVSFAPNGERAQNVRFNLYHIANYNKNGIFVLTEKYKSLPIDVQKTSTDHLRKLITTIDGYIAANKISADKSGVTDENGVASFANLKAGMYIVRGEKFSSSSGTYKPATFMVTLPSENSKGNLNYNVTSEPKWESESVGYVNLEVLKLWDDDSNPNRAKSVTVELYVDGILFDTVVLDGASNWRYRWYNLPANHEFLVREKNVPAGYSVTVEKQGNRFVITNSKTDNVDSPSDGTTSDDTKLPVTGVLWWPVPVLICLGLVLLILGFSRRRIDNEIK